MGVGRRRQLRWQCARLVAQRHRSVVLASTAVACFMASAVSGWGAPPTSWQVIAAACGGALTFSAYRGGQQHPPVAIRKKMSRILTYVNRIDRACDVRHMHGSDCARVGPASRPSTSCCG
jgi:hypothetical protein